MSSLHRRQASVRVEYFKLPFKCFNVAHHGSGDIHLSARGPFEQCATDAGG